MEHTDRQTDKRTSKMSNAAYWTRNKPKQTNVGEKFFNLLKMSKSIRRHYGCCFLLKQ